MLWVSVNDTPARSRIVKVNCPVMSRAMKAVARIATSISRLPTIV